MIRDKCFSHLHLGEKTGKSRCCNNDCNGFFVTGDTSAVWGGGGIFIVMATNFANGMETLLYIYKLSSMLQAIILTSAFLHFSAKII